MCNKKLKHDFIIDPHLVKGRRGINPRFCIRSFLLTTALAHFSVRKPFFTWRDNPSHRNLFRHSSLTGGLCTCKIRVNGFTLVEMLVAFIIFALIVTSLYNMLYNGMTLDAKSQFIQKTYSEAIGSFDELTLDFSHSIAYDFSGFSNEQKSFIGLANKMTVVVPSPNGIEVITYFIGRPNMGQVTKTILVGIVKQLKSGIVSSYEEVPVDFLLRRRQTIGQFLSQQQDDDRQLEILHGGLTKEGFALEYSNFSKPLEWKSQWLEDGLPAAVRVTLQLYDPSKNSNGVVLQRIIFYPQGKVQE